MTEEELDLEITAMQTDWLVDNRRKRRWIIVEEPDGVCFTVHEHSIDGVAPQIRKGTKEEAAARLLQCLGIHEPVTPQNWPESICIGFVDTEDHQRHAIGDHDDN